jgi:hypothetical protein
MGLQPEVPRSMSKKIVWDEENLAENERIKATLPQVKINEPKTPWNELLPEDGLDLPPLSLDGEDTAPVANNWSDLPDSSKIGPNIPMVISAESPAVVLLGNETSSMSHLMRLPEFDHILDPNTRNSENSTRLSSNSSNTASGRTGAGSSKFDSLRKSHYNMKSALTSKLEDEEEDEEEEEAATPEAIIPIGDDAPIVEADMQP